MVKIVVLTMCPNGGCPRMGVTGRNAFFRDDYKGKISMKTKLLMKISSL
ncbi:MAG: hypothetical protein KGI04_00090 [Candidatus Micrarchaeota archaeon]|nr:hypothetical protein [Candidatus Micrarchaeota archaeon]